MPNDQTHGHLIILSGPSGVGKGTICKELLKRDPRLALSISATTRPQGPGEIHGKDYYFCTPEEFQALEDQDGFLEWAEVHGNRYGTLKLKVKEILDSGKDCILEIDVQGGPRFLARCPSAASRFLWRRHRRRNCCGGSEAAIETSRNPLPCG